jgi:predicted phosphodiesterase
MRFLFAAARPKPSPPLWAAGRRQTQETAANARNHSPTAAAGLPLLTAMPQVRHAPACQPATGSMRAGRAEPMRYGIISDIHANLDAFQVVLKRLKDVDAYICLGDIVGYGPDPDECVDIVRGLPGLKCVVGNHDLACVGRYDINWFNWYAREAIVWTQTRLSPASRSYLLNLPLMEMENSLTLVHGALPQPMDYVTSEREARSVFAEMITPVCLIGHTHIAEYYANAHGAAHMERRSLAQGGDIKFGRGMSYIINSGSVGQPRDGNSMASYGIYDTTRREVKVKRIAYPVEAVQAKIAKAGLPEVLGDRLAIGR